MNISIELHEALLEVSLSYKVFTHKDEDRPYRVILFKPKPHLTPKESFEITKSLYMLPGSKNFLITEDFSE